MLIKAILCVAFACLVTGKPHGNHGHHYGQHKHNPLLNTGARPSTGTCGIPAITPNTVSQFIVGGNEAKEHSYPWMATLETNNFQFCGASLLDHNHAITAAHCVANGDTHVIVGLGLHDKNHQDSHHPWIQKMSISRIEQHRQYDSSELKNDLAMITFSESVIYNDWVSPVCVAADDKPAGTLATATGWGALTEGGSTPSLLHEVTKPIISDTDCQNYYAAVGWNVFPDEMLCSGFDEGGKDACQGDSGGPLVVKSTGHAHGDSWELVGITSWGYGCARPQFPGVYTDVANYNTWIKNRLD